MRFDRHHDIKEATFDLTAMIDVVLLLIIFFMLSSQFVQVDLSPVPLPEEPGEEYASSEQIERALVINLDAQGEISVMDLGVLTSEQLLAEVDRHRQGAGGVVAGLEVVIRADRSCRAIHLNRLAGVLARGGVRTWKLATTGTGGGG